MPSSLRGNTTSDLKLGLDPDINNVANFYSADIISSADYYPFGMPMSDRTISSENYRFGFNGKEKDPSISSLTHYDYGFRIYNPGIARFLSVDPLTRSYPWYTQYQFAGNMPIWAMDLDGLEPIVHNGKIIGYTVRAGQGPTQIALDINNPEIQKQYGYTILEPISWVEIIDNTYNSIWFNHIRENRYDKFNASYKNLAYSIGETLNIESRSRTILPNLKLDIDINDKENLLPNTLTLMKMFSLENKLNGGEYLEPGKYDLSHFLKNVNSLNKSDLSGQGIKNMLSGSALPGVTIYSLPASFQGHDISLTYSLQSGNKLTLTDTEERYNRLLLVTYGFKTETGADTRLIQIDFGNNKKLFNLSKIFNQGEISLLQLKNNLSEAK